MHGGKERRGVFRVAGGDSPPALEMEEGIFGQMT